MAKTISALDLHYLVKELRFLINARVDKIYVQRKKEIIIDVFAPAKGKYSIKINEKSFYLTELKPKSQQPTEFCMFLRKKLNGARIKKITQLDFERVITILFETKEAKYELIAEIFSKGNIILTKDTKILVASEYQNWSNRTIRPNIKYFPPKKEYNFLTIQPKEFKQLLQKTNRENLVKSLAIDLGLGGVYAEEACLQAGVDKDKSAKQITKPETKKLFEKLIKLKSKKLEPATIYKNKEVLDLIPFKLKLYEKHKQEPAKSFSSILNDYFSNITSILEKEAKNKQIDKIDNIINGQKEDIKQLTTQEKINHEKAEALYNNYQTVANILKELKEISKEHSWKEIKNKLKGHKVVKEVTSKDKSIIIELK